MFTVQQQNAAIAAAQYQQQVAQGLEDIFSAYPTLLRCDANRKLITEHIRDFMECDFAPDLETFRNLIALNPDILSTMVQRPTEVTKAQYIDEDIELLAAHSRQDKYSLQSERNRLNHLSLEACRQKLDELKRRQKMAAFPVSDLKAYVADARRDDRPYAGFPILPKTVWNGTTHIPLNATTIRAMDAWEIKRFSRLYGQQQLNDRLKETA